MRIELLRPALAERVANLLFNAFRDDPHNWGRALRRPPELFKAYITEIYMPEVVTDSTPSLVGFDSSDSGEDELAGTLILEDFHKSDKPSTNLDESSQPIPAFMRAAHNTFWSELAIRKGENPTTAGNICYFAWLGVSSSHRRKRIGESLVKCGVEEAQRAGFRIGVAFCTSPGSAALFAKVGFERWGELVYKEFTLPTDGSIPFHELPDGTSVMVKYPL